MQSKPSKNSSKKDQLKPIKLITAEEMLDIAATVQTKDNGILPGRVLPETVLIAGDEKAIIFKGRMERVFLPLLNALNQHKPILQPEDSVMGHTVFKYLRLRHHNTNPNIEGEEYCHIVCYAVFSLTGVLGLSRDDGRELKHEIELINDVPWYKLPCPKKGCEGAVRINPTNTPGIIGKVDYSNFGVWRPLPEIEGYVII